MSGSVEEIRENSYSTLEGGLHYGPYRIEDGIKKSLTHFKRGLSELRQRWATTKIKEFRTVLSRGKTASEQFLLAMKARGLTLPETVPAETGYAKQGWENMETPYHDLIEMLDFYPDTLLDQAETR